MSSTELLRNPSDEKNADCELTNMLSNRLGILCIFFFALSIQVAVSSGSYSGLGTPPMFGDFEAQRHWMELTIHLPIDKWYVNGSDNDLNYWGLDYPPLTAFHSFVLGKLSGHLNRSWVALYQSRGIESTSHKLFMRVTVLVSLWLLYIPVLVVFIHLSSSSSQKIYHCCVAIFYPALISIDNGHFQYNHVSLGLSLFAVLCLTLRWRVAACALFVMALNFKQMQLYHSLPIAAFLFSTSIHSTSSTLRNITSTFKELMKLFLVVAITFLLIWCPFIVAHADLLQILHRIFPFYRGIFEDKVANLWCALNVVVKLKGYDATGLIKLSTVCVLCAHIPCILALLLRPDASNFKNALFVSSLSFFLFSFQVHEKSILLAAVPALIIWNDRPVTISWFLIITNCSLYPLCVKDGNAIHLIIFISYYFLLSPKLSKLSQLKWTIVHSSCLASVTLCAASLVISPPKRYPDIFPLLNAIFCCAHFVMFLIYFNYLIVTHTYAVIGTDKHRVKLE